MEAFSGVANRGSGIKANNAVMNGDLCKFEGSGYSYSVLCDSLDYFARTSAPGKIHCFTKLSLFLKYGANGSSVQSQMLKYYFVIFCRGLGIVLEPVC